MSGPVRFDSLAGWLRWQEQLHPQAIAPGLARVARVAQRSGWSAPRCPVITVGGTNGKGSCVAIMDAVLRAGGYRTGSFTSPHLVDYRERIRLRGEPVSAESLICAFERIADALGPDTLTFFEFNTLAALLIFETAALDALVLEVGMGGRLDAVNIVDADVALVVSVGIDHVEWLGADLESIGYEKAGIFRQGRPALYGGDDPPPRSLVEVARSTGAHLKLRGRDFRESIRTDGLWDLYAGEQAAEPRLAGLPMPALAGRAQPGNAATALAALLELRDRLPLGRDAIESGLANVALAGRFQHLKAQGIDWILDVAHNPAAARVLAANLRSAPVNGKTIAVCGMLNDKDVPAVLAELQGCVDTWIAATTLGERGLADHELAGRASKAGVAMLAGGTVARALQTAAGMHRVGDRIVVLGSFHTVGPALGLLGERDLVVSRPRL